MFCIPLNSNKEWVGKQRTLCAGPIAGNIVISCPTMLNDEMASLYIYAHNNRAFSVCNVCT